jgi:hypothetical protein
MRFPQICVLFSTLQLLISDVNILLIIPIFFYTGIELVVMFVQFTTVS